MVTICAWCQKYMGSMEPFHDPAVSHGICTGCIERDSLEDAPVLVVSPRRAQAIPVLEKFTTAAKESPERTAAEKAVTELRAGRKPVDEFVNLRREVLDMQKENRALRKDFEALKKEIEAKQPTPAAKPAPSEKLKKKSSLPSPRNQ